MSVSSDTMPPELPSINISWPNSMPRLLPAGAVIHSETGTMTSMVANGTNENATALGITR